jgi:4-diphosphocytidyl-2-C-methyl-D-erythritol kinase
MLQLKAPAKLNLFLHVTGQRSDGYHLLQSLFVPINWCDEIELTPTHDGAIERRSSHPWPAEDDICIKAARQLKAVAISRGLMRPSLGCDIFIHKSIPHGAGLGGGSSDAATCLKGLQELWQISLSNTELAELGLGLGADVPFFLRSGPALVTGIGETLRRLVPKARHFVVAVPRVEVATARVFQDKNLRRNNPALGEDAIEAALKQSIWTLGHNDLCEVAFKLFPELRIDLELLVRAAGLQGLPPEAARMSGSGSSLFCSCESQAQAERIMQWLVSQPASSQRFRGMRAVQAYL